MITYMFIIKWLYKKKLWNLKKKKKKKKKELEKTDEINIFIEKYKTMEFKLIDNGRSRNDIYEFRFKCLINLNDINT